MTVKYGSQASEGRCLDGYKPNSQLLNATKKLFIRVIPTKIIPCIFRLGKSLIRYSSGKVTSLHSQTDMNYKCHFNLLSFLKGENRLMTSPWCLCGFLCPLFHFWTTWPVITKFWYERMKRGWFSRSRGGTYLPSNFYTRTAIVPTTIWSNCVD
jgi:hypothetical protein